jgi:thioredoxin 1
MSVIHIENEQEFQEKVVQFTGISIVDFRAEWCGPCRMLGPIMEDLSTEYAGKPVQVIKVNVDENRALAEKFQVSSIPVVFIIQ